MPSGRCSAWRCWVDSVAVSAACCWRSWRSICCSLPAPFDSHTPATTLATYLYPILAAHGWFLRSRIALAHAALASIALLLAELLLRTGSVQAITQAALVGAGYFLLALLGMLLGRSAEESEHRAALRTADVRRLAHINQVVINELEDGVLAVGALGQIVMANPQATRWLGGDEASMQRGVQLHELSPDLHARWQAFFVSGSTLDAAPIRTRDGQRSLVPRMMPVDLEERAGTLVFSKTWIRPKRRRSRSSSPRSAACRPASPTKSAIRCPPSSRRHS